MDAIIYLAGLVVVVIAIPSYSACADPGVDRPCRFLRLLPFGSRSVPFAI